MAYLGPLDCLCRLADPALGWPNHLSTYILGALGLIWVSLMAVENTTWANLG